MNASRVTRCTGLSVMVMPADNGQPAIAAVGRVHSGARSARFVTSLRRREQ
jgi:hypothetical protein